MLLKSEGFRFTSSNSLLESTLVGGNSDTYLYDELHSIYDKDVTAGSFFYFVKNILKNIDRNTCSVID